MLATFPALIFCVSGIRRFALIVSALTDQPTLLIQWEFANKYGKQCTADSFSSHPIGAKAMSERRLEQQRDRREAQQEINAKTRTFW